MELSLTRSAHNKRVPLTRSALFCPKSWFSQVRDTCQMYGVAAMTALLLRIIFTTPVMFPLLTRQSCTSASLNMSSLRVTRCVMVCLV